MFAVNDQADAERETEHQDRKGREFAGAADSAQAGAGSFARLLASPLRHFEYCHCLLNPPLRTRLFAGGSNPASVPSIYDL
jgi:hypothetical protein